MARAWRRMGRAKTAVDDDWNQRTGGRTDILGGGHYAVTGHLLSGFAAAFLQPLHHSIPSNARIRDGARRCGGRHVWADQPRYVSAQHGGGCRAAALLRFLFKRQVGTVRCRRLRRMVGSTKTPSIRLLSCFGRRGDDGLRRANRLWRRRRAGSNSAAASYASNAVLSETSVAAARCRRLFCRTCICWRWHLTSQTLVPALSAAGALAAGLVDIARCACICTVVPGSASCGLNSGALHAHAPSATATPPALHATLPSHGRNGRRQLPTSCLHHTILLYISSSSPPFPNAACTRSPPISSLFRLHFLLTIAAGHCCVRRSRCLVADGRLGQGCLAALAGSWEEPPTCTTLPAPAPLPAHCLPACTPPACPHHTFPAPLHCTPTYHATLVLHPCLALDDCCDGGEEDARIHALVSTPSTRKARSAGGGAVEPPSFCVLRMPRWPRFYRRRDARAATLSMHAPTKNQRVFWRVAICYLLHASPWRYGAMVRYRTGYRCRVNAVGKTASSCLACATNACARTCLC